MFIMSTKQFIAVVMAMILGTVAVVGCRPDESPSSVQSAIVPAPMDLETMAPCPGEAGPAEPGQSCVWHSTVQGITAPAEWEWVVYVPVCPVETVQDWTTVLCVNAGGYEYPGH